MPHAIGGCGISEEELSNTFVSCLVANDFIERTKIISVFIWGCVFRERLYPTRKVYTVYRNTFAGALVGLSTILLKWDFTASLWKGLCVLCVDPKLFSNMFRLTWFGIKNTVSLVKSIIVGKLKIWFPVGGWIQKKNTRLAFPSFLVGFRKDNMNPSLC